MTNSFDETFEYDSRSQGISASVIRYLRSWMNRNDFPVSFDDDIYKVYGIVDEDLDDLVVTVASENNFLLPPSTEYWETPIEIVRDLVDFVSTFPSSGNRV